MTPSSLAAAARRLGLEVKTLDWNSPRLNQPTVIELRLSTDAALWIAEHLPKGDSATLELFSAIAFTSPPDTDTEAP
jgi:hypothetical protein